MNDQTGFFSFLYPFFYTFTAFFLLLQRVYRNSSKHFAPSLHRVVRFSNCCVFRSLLIHKHNEQYKLKVTFGWIWIWIWMFNRHTYKHIIFKFYADERSVFKIPTSKSYFKFIFLMFPLTMCSDVYLFLFIIILAFIIRFRYKNLLDTHSNRYKKNHVRFRTIPYKLSNFTLLSPLSYLINEWICYCLIQDIFQHTHTKQIGGLYSFYDKTSLSLNNGRF